MRRSWTGWIGSIATIGAVLAGARASAAAPEPEAPAAEAPSDNQRARDLYGEGSNAYSLGQYDVAIEKFEESYELSRQPALLYNLGRAYWKLYDVDPDAAHLRQARTLFQNYLSEVDEGAAHVEKTRTHIVDLEEQLTDLEAPGPAPAEPSPAPEPEPAPTPEPEPAPAPADDERYRPGILGWVGYGLLGVGTVSAAAGGTVGFVSLARLDDQQIQEKEDLGTDYPDGRDDDYETNERRALTLAASTLAIGGALIVAGVALVVVDAKRGKSRAAAWRIRPVAGGLALDF